jgi:hypothetical protein
MMDCLNGGLRVNFIVMGIDQRGRGGVGNFNGGSMENTIVAGIDPL